MAARDARQQRFTSSGAPRLTAQSRNSCKSTSCCAWLPPRRYMPSSAGRITSQARARTRRARATTASPIGSA